MFPGINPAMVGMVVKSKLDEILAGTYPDGLVLKEKTNEKIVLQISDEMKMDGIDINKVDASITYKGVEICFVHAN